MNKKRKMNLPYKLAFIMLILCFPILCASIFVAYVIGSIKYSIICAGIGVVLAFVGIILASLSKEKKCKDNHNNENIIEENNEKI